MPNIVFSDAGMAAAFKDVYKPDSFSFLQGAIGLYVNSLSPNRSTVMGDLVEASWAGYVASPIPIANDPTVDSGGVASADSNTTLSFSNSSGGDVTFRGAFLTDSLGRYLGACLLSGTLPIVIPNGFVFELEVTDFLGPLP